MTSKVMPRLVWSDAETKLLLKVIMENNIIQFMKENTHQREHVVKMIENKFHEHGFTGKTFANIYHKWSNLRKQYMKVKRASVQKGGDTKTIRAWPYYALLDKIYTQQTSLDQTSVQSSNSQPNEMEPTTVKTNIKLTPGKPELLKCGELIYVAGELNYFCFFCQHNEETAQKFEEHLYSNHLTELENSSPLKSNDNTPYHENPIDVCLDEIPPEPIKFEVIEIKEEIEDYPEIFTTQNIEIVARELNTNNSSEMVDIFSCDFCNMNFPTKNKLRNHVRFFQDRRINCDECNQGICGRIQYKKHNGKYHSKKKNRPIRSYMCYICKKSFKSTTNVRMHMRQHTGEKPYQCSDCGKEFYFKAGLLSHIHDNHTFERPFMCTECGECFPFQRRLNTHIKRSHRWKEEMPLPCPICSKTLRNKERLRIHLKIHSNDKPFKCNICNKLFKLRSGYRQHMDIHSDKRRYSCHFCDLTFAQSVGRRGHIRRVHEGIK